MTTIYRNALVFTADDPADQPSAPARGQGAAPERPEAFSVSEGVFQAVGTLDQVRAATASGEDVTQEVDLGGAFVAPGFIDSHTHLTSLGESLTKAQLRECSSLEEIQQALVAHHAQDPDAPRVLGIGWLYDAVGEERPTAAMLDAVLPDVPVFLDANDLHSAWVNTAALQELGITDETPDPVGGSIARDEDGHATGMLYETACTQYAWGHLAEVVTDQDRLGFLDRAFAAYLATGVTGATDMSMNQVQIDTLRALIARDGKLPFPLTAHWLLEPTGDRRADLAGIEEVVRVRDELAADPAVAPWLRISGVKFIMDGVIDACTAPMRWPYADGSNALPIWSRQDFLPMAAAADAAGLQLAMHAIGDQTSRLALDAIEYCHEVNGHGGPRHRIEHLESVAPETAERMARLSVTASMQPVHCDPAVLQNWMDVLGDSRAQTGFPWQQFREAGVEMTLGTDAPTAPHEALANLYIALTGGSAIAPELDPYHPERAFTPAQALTALTAGGSDAGGIGAGRIRAGLPADFIVVSVDPLNVDPVELLGASVTATYVAGELVHGTMEA